MPNSPFTEFDPYFKWLGIPPEEQPPNHYRLLAIPPFTSDPEVIRNAAEQRMAHLKALQLGQRGAFSQSLLNQIAHAKVCLLDEGQRRAYDESLRRSFPVPIAPPPVASAAQPAFVSESLRQPATFIRKRRRRSTKGRFVMIVVGGIAGIALGYLLVSRLDLIKDPPTGVTSGEEQKKLEPKLKQTTDPSDNASSNSEEFRPNEPGEMGSASSGIDAPVLSTSNPHVAAANEEGLALQTPSVPGASEARPSLDTAPEKPEAFAARDLAIASGDVLAAFEAVESLADDPLSAKLEILSKIASPTDSRLYALHFVQLSEQAANEGRIETLRPYTDSLLLAARRADDPALIRRATICILRVQEAE